MNLFSLKAISIILLGSTFISYHYFQWSLSRKIEKLIYYASTNNVPKARKLLENQNVPNKIFKKIQNKWKTFSSIEDIEEERGKQKFKKFFAKKNKKVRDFLVRTAQEKMIAQIVNGKSSSREAETALHVAAENGNVKMMQLLVTYGADTQLLDSKKRPPLYGAMLNEHVDAVKYLLELESGNKIGSNIIKFPNRIFQEFAKKANYIDFQKSVFSDSPNSKERRKQELEELAEIKNLLIPEEIKNQPKNNKCAEAFKNLKGVFTQPKDK